MAFFIVESTGPNRYVWGPYADEAKARIAAGSRHVVVESESLKDGQVIREDELSILQRIGSVTRIDVPTAGDKIKAARLAMGLSQDDLAAQLGVSKAFISAVERGTKATTLDWLHATAVRLGIDPSDLDSRLASTAK